MTLSRYLRLRETRKAAELADASNPDLTSKALHTWRTTNDPDEIFEFERIAASEQTAVVIAVSS